MAVKTLNQDLKDLDTKDKGKFNQVISSYIL